MSPEPSVTKTDNVWGSGDRGVRSGWWWVLVGVGLAASLSMALLWPINYDEAFNRIYYADAGFRFIVTDYAYPNNQILFTLIESLVPRRLISLDPLLLRLPNILASTALVVAFAWDHERPATAPLRGMALVFAGPFALQYFGQARGFQLGALLAGLAILALVKFALTWWAVAAATLLMALAAYAVPTFAFGAPIITLWLLLRREFLRALLYSVGFMALSTLLYAPLLDQLFSARTNEVSQFRPPTDYASDVMTSSFFLPVLLTIVLGIVAGVVLVKSGFEIDWRPASSKAFLFIGFCLSFLLVAEVVTYMDVAASPFVRNAAFFPMFVIVGLWNSRLTQPAIKWVVVALIGVNTVLGMIWLTSIVDGSGIVDYRGTTIGQTRRLDALIGRDVAQIRCGWTDEWTCRLYEDELREAGIEVRNPVDDVVPAPCVIGEHPPTAGTGIQVVSTDGEIGLVCYG